MAAKTKKSSSLAMYIPTFLGVIIIFILMIPLFAMVVFMNLSKQNIPVVQAITGYANPFPDASQYHNPFVPTDTPYVNPFGQ